MLEPRIRVYWGKKENDLMVAWDEGASRQTSKYLISQVFPKEVLQELDRRGYDTTTIRFQIRKKPPSVLDQLARIDADA